MSKDIPDWAKARALELAQESEPEADFIWEDVDFVGNGACIAFARYISEHEDEPVDPLLEALDEAYEKTVNLDDTREHRTKFAEVLRETLRKRGIELAKEGSQ